MTNYLGQIGIYGFNFAPYGWAYCAGNIVAISQYSALYALIGTTYGGNGQTTFGLPNLQSRTPMCFGTQTSMGEMAGTENVTLMLQEMPIHTHLLAASNNLGNIAGDGAHILAQPDSAATGQKGYLSGSAPNIILNPAAVSPAGGSQPHNNIQPCLTVNFCIAMTGIFPARN